MRALLLGIGIAGTGPAPPPLTTPPSKLETLRKRRRADEDHQQKVRKLNDRDREHIRSKREGISEEEFRARMTPQIYGGALAFRRKRLKLTLEEAAAATGMTPYELEQLEAGFFEPSEEQMVAISETYRWGLRSLRESMAHSALLRSQE